jgi:transcriptional regulator with XRE-family HTH domain
LRQIRLRAGLSQEQVAAAIGFKSRHRRSYVYRLERGSHFSPSLRLVLDYLRACKATPEDLVAVLGTYLAQPLAVPASGKPRHRGPRMTAEDRELLELRKQAAPWVFRQANEHVLHEELNRLGVPAFQRLRKTLVLFGRRVFRVLLNSRGRAESVRHRRLARTRGWRALNGVPAELVQQIEAKVRGLYDELERDGELDRLPDGEQARRIMWRSPGRRIVTDHYLCRTEWAQERKRQLDDYEKRAAPVIEGAKLLLEQAGVTGHAQGNYRGLINAFMNLASLTRPGSAERTEKLEYLFSHSVRPWQDPALLRRLAAFVFERWGAQVPTAAR